VCSIEKANDINELSINELQSSLLIHKQKLNQQDKKEQDLRVSSSNRFLPHKEMDKEEKWTQTTITVDFHHIKNLKTINLLILKEN